MFLYTDSVQQFMKSKITSGCRQDPRTRNRAINSCFKTRPQAAHNAQGLDAACRSWASLNKNLGAELLIANPKLAAL